MPLKTGKSKKTVSDNISELMHTWESTGKIGDNTPKTKKEAHDMAVAIAMRHVGKRHMKG